MAEKEHFGAGALGLTRFLRGARDSRCQADRGPESEIECIGVRETGVEEGGGWVSGRLYVIPKPLRTRWNVFCERTRGLGFLHRQQRPRIEVGLGPLRA